MTEIVKVLWIVIVQRLEIDVNGKGLRALKELRRQRPPAQVNHRP
jgi:hypothetical protein